MGGVGGRQQGSVSGLVLVVVMGKEGGKQEGIAWVTLQERVTVGGRARNAARTKRRSGGSGGAAAATVVSTRT